MFATVMFFGTVLKAQTSGESTPEVTNPTAAVDYLRDVSPILRSKCTRCHNEVDSGGGLRLDVVGEMMKGGDSGVAIVPGNSGESRLIMAVMQSTDLKMPPPDEAKPLDAGQIAILRRWIDEGAIVPDGASTVSHWAFMKPVRPPVPQDASSDSSGSVGSTNTSTARNPIDAFIAERHSQQHLKALPTAPKNVLLRRVYLDLIGLPPTPAQLQAFHDDESPTAWEKVVDELLASPHYGERWGRHWMDVWRYSDWDGYGAEVRESKPHIWRWRDWIIESLNEDKPYDQMITEMLAADEIAPNDAQALRATGFLVRNWYVFNRNTWIDNTIEHTGKAFLGVTLNCARCHDHMYDPISQTEYYQLRAFFEPHEIRTDRIPGQSDISKDGLVRVFDAKTDASTFLFVRGDEKNPLKDKPLSPRVPAVFGSSDLKIQPVDLPPTAYYPGLQSFVTAETLKSAEEELQTSSAAFTAAQQAVAEAQSRLSAFRTSVADAATATPVQTDEIRAPEVAAEAVPGETELAAGVRLAESAAALMEKKMTVASARLDFARARVAADQANFSQPPAANAKELSVSASKAERTFNVLQEELKLLTAEQTLLTARSAIPVDGAPTDESKKKAVTEAEAVVAKAKAALETAQKAAAEPVETYTRLTDVYPSTSTGRRSALAHWIASPENPLTARVAINHMWLRHFHQPLVPTVFDFGANGKPSLHPELLDWLACELMDRDWKMKPLHRLIVTSEAWRRASSPSLEFHELAAGNASLDPENRQFWKQNSRRMEAEVVRDAMLHIAGQLDTTMFGPDLDPSTGLTLGRRSVYFRTSKEKRMTFLATFDSPNPVECYQRAESITPQQSLAMSNSPLTLAQSRIVADRLRARLSTESVEDTDIQFVTLAFREILSREPRAVELQECVDFLQQQSRRFAAKEDLTAFTGGTENSVKPSDDATQRARENLIHVLFNHNDFITIR
jgi:hypothetical protein